MLYKSVAIWMKQKMGRRKLSPAPRSRSTDSRTHSLEVFNHQNRNITLRLVTTSVSQPQTTTSVTVTRPRGDHNNEPTIDRNPSPLHMSADRSPPDRRSPLLRRVRRSRPIRPHPQLPLATHSGDANIANFNHRVPENPVRLRIW